MEGVPKSNEERIGELRGLISEFYNPKNIELYDEMVDFVSKIKSKYPDYMKYELYHILIGSTLKPGSEIVGFDFPGEDSVEQFIRDKVNG